MLITIDKRFNLLCILMGGKYIKRDTFLEDIVFSLKKRVPFRKPVYHCKILQK